MKPASVSAAGSPAPGGAFAPSATDASDAPASHTLDFAARAMRGRWLPADAESADADADHAADRRGTFAGAAFDTRLLRGGELFFALPGQNVDGYEFCAAATEGGAAGLVVEARRGRPANLRAPDGRPSLVPVIGVEDPLTALADLARGIRALFAGRVIGITGSNGKTTTRQLTAAALGAFGSVLATKGNYNTEIGLPLTIISASGQEAFWVLEMAMRGRGQIALLADIARPHVGVITNVSGAHLELLGSIAEVARAKGELFAALGDEGIAILPGGDPLVEAQAAHIPRERQFRFDAGERSGDLDVVILESLPAGAAGQVARYAVRRQPVVARLPLSGTHNARNAGAALAVTAALGLPAPAAARSLSDTVLPPHRSFPRTVAGRVILDDCYNANGASMSAALATLRESVSGTSTGGRRAFAIIGDMLELGPETETVHRDIGRQAGAWLAGLAAVGPLAAHSAHAAKLAGLDAARVVATDDPGQAAAAVASWSRPGDWILVKASRGMRLERAIEAMVEEFRKQPGMT